MVTGATLFQAAAGAVLSPKEGSGLFRKLVNALLRN